MKVKKFKTGIFTKLIACFLVFPLILIATAVLCILLELVLLNQDSMENYFPYNIVDEDGNIQNLDAVMSVGGWVEELDSAYCIVQVYGTKKTDTGQYTQEEIYELTSLSAEGEYIGFIYKPENQEHYFLCVYSRESLQISATLVLNADKTSDAGKLSYAFLLVFFVMVILEVFFISLYLRKKIKKPLDKLTEGMERIKSGERNVALEIKTEAEFEQIVDTFHMMTRELEYQKEENGRLVAQKNQMLLELSHDIKTPLATIKGYASALKEGIVPEEKKQSYYDTIDMKADRVSLLMENMFFMLKMENPDASPDTEPINLCEFLRKLCAEYYDEIAEAGFDFGIEIPEGTLTAYVDCRLFARVVGNLLSNAQKYNRTGRRIGLRCRKEEGNAILEVADDGEAIESVLAAQMFTAFVRGDKTRKSDGGTGLGLSISKIIVEKHGGTIGYRRDGGWNVFTITVPDGERKGSAG